jgi:predicted O-methyltransferase YrrM
VKTVLRKLPEKILAGGRAHKTRFHDEKGNLLDAAGLVFLPHCLMTAVARRIFGFRPAVPWLGYRATRSLDSLIQKSWKVLEFGSGSSTSWLAARCSALVSVEHDPDWYAEISRRLRRDQVSNVTYLLRTEKDYARLDDWPDGYFDFVLIDGVLRDRSARASIPKVRSGGSIYLDNSDKHAREPAGETRVAEEALLAAAAAVGGERRYFVDLVPAHLAVTQGLLVQI